MKTDFKACKGCELRRCESCIVLMLIGEIYECKGVNGLPFWKWSELGYSSEEELVSDYRELVE